MLRKRWRNEARTLLLTGASLSKSNPSKYYGHAQGHATPMRQGCVSVIGLQARG